MVVEFRFEFEQQVRQTPIFLGRKKRSSNDGHFDPRVPIEDGNNTSGESDQSWSVDTNGSSTETSESTTQIIEFTYNGQQERYIVAQEVRVNVFIEDPPFDDYTFNDVSQELFEQSLNSSTNMI